MTNPANILTDAAELVREVNHTAAHHRAYEFPSQVYDGYGAMATLIERLTQAVHQHAGWIARETDHRGVAVVSGDYVADPPAAAAAVEHHSQQAAGALLNAAHELQGAHNIVSAMASAHDLTDDPEDDR